MLSRRVITKKWPVVVFIFVTHWECRVSTHEHGNPSELLNSWNNRESSETKLEAIKPDEERREWAVNSDKRAITTHNVKIDNVVKGDRGDLYGNERTDDEIGEDGRRLGRGGGEEGGGGVGGGGGGVGVGGGGRGLYPRNKQTFLQMISVVPVSELELSLTLYDKRDRDVPLTDIMAMRKALKEIRVSGIDVGVESQKGAGASQIADRDTEREGRENSYYDYNDESFDDSNDDYNYDGFDDFNDDYIDDENNDNISDRSKFPAFDDHPVRSSHSEVYTYHQFTDVNVKKSTSSTNSFYTGDKTSSSMHIRFGDRNGDEIVNKQRLKREAILRNVNFKKFKNNLHNNDQSDSSTTSNNVMKTMIGSGESIHYNNAKFDTNWKEEVDFEDNPDTSHPTVKERLDITRGRIYDNNLARQSYSISNNTSGNNRQREKEYHKAGQVIESTVTTSDSVIAMKNVDTRTQNYADVTRFVTGATDVNSRHNHDTERLPQHNKSAEVVHGDANKTEDDADDVTKPINDNTGALTVGVNVDGVETTIQNVIVSENDDYNNNNTIVNKSNDSEDDNDDDELEHVGSSSSSTVSNEDPSRPLFNISNDKSIDKTSCCETGTKREIKNNITTVTDKTDGEIAMEVKRNVSSLLDFLMNGYDKLIRPGFGGGPVIVKADIEIRSMGPISEKDMIYSMDCYFRQVWADRRLSFNATLERVDKLTLNVKMLDRIWKPDTIFGNGGHAYRHTITTPNMFFRLSEDGTILYSQRLTIKANCPMHLEKFPMDTQQCPLQVRSFGYPDKDVHYEWRFGNGRAAKAATDMRMSQFDLKATPACNMTLLFKGTLHSVLTVYFCFRRHTGYFLIQVYLPCCLLVILSWVSFWINREATSERISLGATTMLTLTLIVLDTRNDLPKVSYPTALDMYVATCFSFIFASIVQFAAVHFHTKYGTADEDLPRVPETDDEVEEDEETQFLQRSDNVAVEASSKDHRQQHHHGCRMFMGCLKKTWGCLMTTRKNQKRFTKHVRSALGLNSVSRIDKMARIVFPAAFSGFNIVYWMIYLRL